MAYLRDRRAFGNIGTRKFRGARFGDPLSPRGPQYTKEGLILDYSTDVGPFTIIDQSGQDNTATLYSGRGLTMDGVSDLIDFGSPTFSEPVTSVTGYARSTDTSINLGLTSATLAGNDTWETFSADTAAKDYGDAQWFNGVNTEVVIPDSADFNISTSIDISADVLLTSTASVGILNKGGGSAGLREWRVEVNSSNEISFFVFDDSLSANVGTSTSDFPTNELFTVRGYYDGSDIYIYINGVQKATTAGVIAIENLAADIQLGNTLSASRHLNGVVSNVSISVDGTEVAAYTGLGNDPWVDTIGSNNGTELGTFTSELVSASDANDQIDALGTAILEPRRNTQQLNLFGEGEYSRTPDSDSLDLTTEATWEMWGNFYGVPAATYDILSKFDTGSQRSWRIASGSAGAADELAFLTSSNGVASATSTLSGLTNKVSHVCFTLSGGVLLAYIDGVSATIAPALNLPLFNSTAPVLVGALRLSGVESFFADKKIGSAKIYNRALTADEVLTNYESQKSLYLNVFPFTLPLTLK